MYSTSIIKEQQKSINQQGLLKSARWTSVKEITDVNRIEAGKELFNLQCLGCHTLNGIRNDLVEKVDNYTYLGILSLLHGQGKIQTYMPEFMGTTEEKEALAVFITSRVLNKEITKEPASFSVSNQADDIPEFNKDNGKYVLLVWNDLGMHCVSDSDPWFVILPPANTLEAQLIKRGEVPELIAEGVELLYRVESGHENPAGHVEFWKYAGSNFNISLEKNTGLSGNGLSGKFEFDEDRNSFIAKAIPVVPYKDDGSYVPYPLFSIKALEQQSGNFLLETKVVAPVSTEMGCRNCHQGGWRVNNVAGISEKTAVNILLVHDRLNDTDLYRLALQGKPQLCQNCHADPALEAQGIQGVLNFSAAMHGWHANYMPYDDARACVLCHPASHIGNTRCNRGFHNTLGITCSNCHGTMQEHALSLLNGEKEKARAAYLMVNLNPQSVETKQEINPRKPWLKEPDCLTCHQDFERPQQGKKSSAFNIWNEDFSELYRIRTDNVGIRCAACHGSTHALYPASNPFGRHRDNMQPMQYSGLPYPIGSNLTCEVCHLQKMEDAVHHENMEHMFRNTHLFEN